MRIRRAALLLVEPREVVSFDLAAILEGGDGLVSTSSWCVYAVHRDAEVRVDAAQLALLGRIGALQWHDRDAVVGAGDHEALDALLAEGLVLAEDDDAHADWRARDDALRETHWLPLSAAAHYFTRWQDVAAGAGAREAGLRSMSELRGKLGAPPPHVVPRGAPEARVALPAADPDAFDALLSRRATCRNYDTARALPVAACARMLHRVFGAQGEIAIDDDTVVLKKHSPSGGGLHPTSAYVVAQHVDGIAPGLYHYHPQAHALEPVAAMSRDTLRAWCETALAGQSYFADAHVIVAMACRFRRSFWKYRQHPKAYRAVVLDVGHLSQTLYLSATDLGLGAFVTAAVNEKAIEAAFALDPIVESPIAVAGFGWRAATRTSPEFDPLARVWPAPVAD